jgi:hypothetical protein
MMHSDPPAPPVLDPELPPPRETQPTLPFELEEYARWSCLPDEDDELVFEAGAPLDEIYDRVPHVVAEPDEQLTPCEALLLSLVDDVSPVNVLVQLTGARREEALVGMCDLYSRGLVAFD